MSPRDARLQAAALRLAAERLDRGEPLAPELASALADDMSRHPRDPEDAGTEEDGEVVMARLLAHHARW